MVRFIIITRPMEYSTDEEYRRHLRDIMKMSIIDASFMDDVDAVSKDEWNFDGPAVTQFLDDIYSKTCHKMEFEELYMSAAACMFSEDPTIGLAVLFSYDYLKYFYPCLCAYFEDGRVGENYDYLMEKFRH
jgi:hypothetical protein